MTSALRQDGFEGFDGGFVEDEGNGLSLIFPVFSNFVGKALSGRDDHRFSSLANVDLC